MKSLLLALAAALLLDVQADELLFYHAFDNGLMATHSAGSAAPLEVIGTPAVVAGREGGSALLLRNGLDAVGFATAGNLNPQAGAISLWVAPGDNWGYTKDDAFVFGGTQVLFHTGAPQPVPQRLVVQTFWRSNVLGMLTYRDGQLLGGWPSGVFQTVVPYPGIETAPALDEPRPWHHLLFTWREGRLDTYLDGQRVRRFARPDLNLGNLGDRFYLGWKRDPNPDVDLDDPMLMQKGMVVFDPGFVEPATKQMNTPWETKLADVAVFGVYLGESRAQQVYSDGALAAARGSGQRGLPPNSLLFHADYDENLAPTVSQSQQEVVPRTAGKPGLVSGKSGQAIQVTARESDVVYPLAGHLRADAGTLAFWLSPENWDAKDEVLQVLFSTNGERRFQVQNNPRARSALEFQWFRGRYINERVTGFGKCAVPLIQHETLVEGIERLNPGTWYHVAWTWGDGEIRAYRNGIEVNRAAFPAFGDRQTSELGDAFSIGRGRRWGRRLVTTQADLEGKQYGPGFNADWAPLLEQTFTNNIDDVVIFDRPLSGPQIARLQELGVGAFMAAEAAGANVAELSVKPLPTRGQIVFEAIHDAAPPHSTARVRITAVDDPQQQQTIPLDIAGDMARGEMATDTLPPGTYTAAFSLADADGTTLARNDADQTFVLAPREEWWHNRLGLDEVVPPPWSPMTVDRAAGTVRCWGRVFRFTPERPLPVQIRSAGDDLLVAPLALPLSLNGTPLDFGPGTVRWPLVSDTAVERSWQAAQQGVDLTVHTRIEFDGFTWFTVTVANDSGHPITGLAYEQPCQPANAQFMHTPSRGWREPCPPDVTTPDDWQGAFGGFNTPVWLGDYDRGMQWLAEGRGGWYNQNHDDEIRVTREDDHVRLRVKMIGSPCERQAFSIAFGIHPTPVKPPIRRSKRRGPVGCYGVVPYLPRPNPAEKRSEQEFFQDWHAGGKAASPEFFCYNFLNSVASYYDDGTPVRERNWYKAEWENLPGYERLEPLSWSWFSVCAETSYSDWWVWQIKERIANPDYGGMAGIYFDHGHPISCCNPLHQGRCGYRDEDGVLQTETKILAMRRLLMRIYKAIKGIDAEHPQGTDPYRPVVLHMSTELIAPHISMVDFIFDGETFKVDEAHWMDRLSPSFMAAEWSHTAWGYNERGTCFKAAYFYRGFDPQAMKEINPLFHAWRRSGLNPKRLEELQANEHYEDALAYGLSRTRELNGMFFLFDRTPSDNALGYFLGYTDYRDELERLYADFGYWEDDCQFEGYWRDLTQRAVQGQTARVKVSVYRRPAANKALLAITNMNDAQVDRELLVDPAALGLEGPFHVVDGESRAAATTLQKQQRLAISLRIPGRDYRLILLSGPRPELPQ